MWELQVINLSDHILKILFTLCAILVLSSCLPRWKMLLKYRRLPPGPFSWPLVGYVPFLDTDKNYLSLNNEAKKYGSVISFFVGTQYVVVIHDFQDVKQAYNKEEFQSRPHKLIMPSPHPEQMPISSLCGLAWKEQKKALLNGLRLTGTEEHHSALQVQIEFVTDEIKHQLGKDVNANRLVEHAFNNNTFNFVFGKMYDHRHKMIKFLEEFHEAILTFVVLNGLKFFFPWIGYLVKYAPTCQRAEKILNRMDDLLREEIHEHEISLEGREPRDLVDYFLLQMRSPGMSHIFSMDNLLANIKVDLFAASETARNVSVWFLMLMAEYPEVQSSIHAEIDRVLGRERIPLYEDRTKLPLLEAAIFETMRFRNLMHLSIPRMASRDTTLCGYDIPEGTILFLNMTSLFRNPRHWKDPDVFDPDRFLSQDRSQVVVPENFIPFSYGKKSCPGEKPGSALVFTFACRLLQLFRVEPPEGGVNLDIKFNKVNGQAHPFVRFSLRDNMS